MKVILNADDFGRSSDINQAVTLAHSQGVLTSASLMITGGAAQQAVALAREMPNLAVGLHIVIACGRSILSPREIPHLVDSEGEFSCDPVRAGFNYFLSPTARQELAREIAAQFEHFAHTGLPLSHVDGHLNMHVHPAVFPILLTLAKQHGARGFRLPRDDLLLSLGFERQRARMKIAWAIIFASLSNWCLPHLIKNNLCFTNRVYGLMQSGRMHELYVINLLHSLKVPTAEIYFHPSTKRSKESLGPNQGDLATLLSPRVLQAIQERNIRLATYQTLC